MCKKILPWKLCLKQPQSSGRKTEFRGGIGMFKLFLTIKHSGHVPDFLLPPDKKNYKNFYFIFLSISRDTQ